MAQLFSIDLFNGQQTIVIPGAPGGAHQLHLAAATQPVAGTITVEYRFVGETTWRALPGGSAIPLTAPAVLPSFGGVVGYRFTIAGLSGGAGLNAWLVDGDAYGLLASHFTDPTGQNSRLRVDVGQTGFFAGREFRTFKVLSIAAAGVYTVRAVVPVNIILAGLEVSIDNGQIALNTYAGGTTGGTFNETLPVFPRNTMSERPTPLYVPQVALTAGGTVSGGTLLDVIRLKVENSSGQAASVGNSEQDERGVGAGTYYFQITNIGTGQVDGTFKARWEERP